MLHAPSKYIKDLPPYPLYSFIGGMSYDTSRHPSTRSPYSAKSYSGENYAYFRLYNAVDGSQTYRSTIYVNLPMAVFQYEKDAVGLVFNPVSEGRPLSVCISSAENGVIFEYCNNVRHC